MEPTEAPAHALPWSRNPDVMAGELVFAGTRVLVSSLFHTLADGGTMDDFYRNWPTVPREQVLQALEQSGQVIEHVTLGLVPSDVLQRAA